MPYSDVAEYDASTARYAVDLPHYRALARRQSGAALDLCCGTGRVTLVLREECEEVVGVDSSGEMLAGARAKSDRIEWVHGDCARLELGRRFDLITCGFNSFQHFTTDAARESLLATVHRHLKPNGLFAFDLWNDLPGSVKRFRPRPLHRVKGLLKEWAGSVLSSRLPHFTAHHDTRNRLCRLEWKWHGPKARVRTVTYRCYQRDELARFLKEAGFEITSLWGGFSGEPWSADSEHLVVVCRAATLS